MKKLVVGVVVLWEIGGFFGRGGSCQVTGLSEMSLQSHCSRYCTTNFLKYAISFVSVHC